jgi:hypothetical protein
MQRDWSRNSVHRLGNVSAVEPLASFRACLVNQIYIARIEMSSIEDIPESCCGTMSNTKILEFFHRDGNGFSLRSGSAKDSENGAHARWEHPKAAAAAGLIYRSKNAEVPDLFPPQRRGGNPEVPKSKSCLRRAGPASAVDLRCPSLYVDLVQMRDSSSGMNRPLSSRRVSRCGMNPG